MNYAEKYQTEPQAGISLDEAAGTSMQKRGQAVELQKIQQSQKIMVTSS
jgi:hypothetical protein